MEVPKSHHGNFTIETQGQIVTVKSFGAWNQETVDEFCTELMEASRPLYAKPWCMIIDMREWGLCSPEAWCKFDETLKIFLGHKLIYQALIAGLSIQQYLLENQKSRTKSPILVEFVDSMEGAFMACERQLKLMKSEK
ncbi:hypothetical protein L4C34_18805 [Vibrio profundum]|uniref:hypothetical protein n=1 Tax=Vibrio profundum TaxID=2910247 RepID=UPI003D09D124